MVEFCQKEIEIIEARVKRCDEKIPACKKKRHSWKYFPEHNPGVVSRVLSCEHCGVIKKRYQQCRTVSEGGIGSGLAC